MLGSNAGAAEYMDSIGALGKKADEIYRHMNFDRIAETT